VMKPADLLTGKIVGIGIVSVGQLLVVAGAGVIAGAAKGTLAVPSGTAVAIALVIVCFVLGHLLYASLYAGAAALVDRQEEQQSAVMPFTSLLIAAYVFSNQALAHPRGTFAIVGRVALHAASAFQVILGLVLLAATIPIAIGIAGRLYRGGVLATGGRIKFGTALRNARQGS
jgi:ABC-2 type transport system permease protein